MTKQEKIEFRLFCINATDSQLINIIQKEKKAAKTSNYRRQCYKIADAVQVSRCCKESE